MTFLHRGAKIAVKEHQTKVLVVDDEAAILEMIQFALEQAGFQAKTAANAYDALLCINDDRPDGGAVPWKPFIHRRYIATV